MSRLEELIGEYCPNGVEFKPIKEVYRRLRGTPITAAKMKEIKNAEGDVRIFAGGKTVIDTFEEDIPKANITRIPAVLIQSRGVIDAVYYEKPFTFKNEMWAYTHENKTAVKFLYYVLKNNMQKFREAASGMGALPQISLKVTEDFEVPVPPLEVQSEIVRILDNFTELTARKKQYEYYRDSLLTGNTEIPKVKLKDVSNVIRGKRVVKSDLTEDGAYPVYQNALTPMGYYTKKNRESGTYLISAGAAGSIGFSNNDFWAADDCFTFECSDKIQNKYLYYVLCNHQTLINTRVRKASIPRLSRESVESIYIPLPALEVQNRLIEVLDNFDSICSDLNIGLPAEIEARKKQYEYYRDKLLSF